MRAWPAVRAALISGLILVECADAMPLPELRPGHLKNPIAQDEIRRWTQVLQALGVETDEAAVTAQGLAVGERAQAFRLWFVAPFKPLRELTGTGQSWGLFAYPDPHAGRLVVEYRTAAGVEAGEAGWQLRFRAPAGAGRWDRLSQKLRYRRVRGVYDDAGDLPRPRPLYERFVDWTAREVFLVEPDAVEVRVRIDLVEVRLPGEGEEPPEEKRHARIRRREKLLADEDSAR